MHVQLLPRSRVAKVSTGKEYILFWLTSSTESEKVGHNKAQILQVK